MSVRLNRFFLRHLWLAYLLGFAVVAFIVVKLVLVEGTLHPRGWAQVGLFMLGLLGATALTLTPYAQAALSRRYRVGFFLGGALAVSGLYLGLGLVGHGRSVNPATFPRDLQCFGAGTASALAITCSWYLSLGTRRLLRHVPRRASN